MHFSAADAKRKVCLLRESVTNGAFLAEASPAAALDRMWCAEATQKQEAGGRAGGGAASGRCIFSTSSLVI